jgi:hypothetical protein
MRVNTLIGMGIAKGIRAGVCAAFLTALVPSAAYADDPCDPAMRSTRARARDHAIIRQLNLNEAAMVRERDARYAQGWAAWRGDRGSAGGESDTAARTRDHARALADYARSRAQYERDMAAWHRAVDACRSGEVDACAN